MVSDSSVSGLSGEGGTATTATTITRQVRRVTWPVVECDQNDSPNLYDIVTPEVAAEMPVGTEVIVAFTERNSWDYDESVALTWGYAALAVVTEQKPTNDGRDVVICVRLSDAVTNPSVTSKHPEPHANDDYGAP